MATADPERDLVRRLLPFSVPAAAIAFAIGAVTSGAGAGWSAALAIAVVAGNLVLSGLSIAWAAGISPVAIYAVALGGFVVRLTVFLVLLVVLTRFGWFSPVAFTAAFVPATLALLVAEMRLLASPKLQADLWYFREQRS
jgi:hypothetical protein